MQRPRVKPEHMPYRLSNGKIRVGGVVYGIAGEITDASGVAWDLLQAMNGERTAEEVVALVYEQHPQSSPEAIRRWLTALADAGYVYDELEIAPEELSERDLSRYDRSRRFFRWMTMRSQNEWDPQLKVKSARAVIIGVGGTGGSAALSLAASGIGQLHVVDPDVVELSNLNRQIIFNENDIGEPKADAAVRHLKALNSDIQITGEKAAIGSADDVAALAESRDLLLLCADNPRDTRVWTNHGCLAAGTPWIDAGYHGPLVQFTLYTPGHGGCWECMRMENRERHLAQGAIAFEEPSDIERRAATANAVNAVSAGISGHLAAHAALSFLTGIPPIPVGRVHTVNLYDLAAEPVVQPSPRRPDCQACGTPSADE